MISIEDRQRAVELIAVACNEGATLAVAPLLVERIVEFTDRVQRLPWKPNQPYRH
ncbi:hypothetical protein [Halomonas sp. BC1]|uniref:hypothetical protein n=1 Tax=Halomonas sp. BC1 TaxID=1670448 RepID=UPI001592E40B|nr:hypothetical protein [Halomonas sp. BC1]